MVNLQQIKSSPKKEIAGLRVGIDKTDKKIIALLAERFKWTKKVGEYKAKNNLPAKDPTREREVFENRKRWAKQSGVDEILVAEIFKTIIALVRQNHHAIKNIKTRNR
ncbi:MAG: chorismate mutase [Candidatus Vogelbacteria bacterium]|nr:chorismate mutase [Candidatus Vogelbacteria bacterium]